MGGGKDWVEGVTAVKLLTIVSWSGMTFVWIIFAVSINHSLIECCLGLQCQLAIVKVLNERSRLQ